MNFLKRLFGGGKIVKGAASRPKPEDDLLAKASSQGGGGHSPDTNASQTTTTQPLRASQLAPKYDPIALARSAIGQAKYLRVLMRRHQEGNPTMVLKCSGCGHHYNVGVDSVIVTNRDVTETFANAEQLKASGVFSHSPDLVATVWPCP